MQVVGWVEEILVHCWKSTTGKDWEQQGEHMCVYVALEVRLDEQRLPDSAWEEEIQGEESLADSAWEESLAHDALVEEMQLCDESLARDALVEEMQQGRKDLTSIVSMGGNTTLLERKLSKMADHKGVLDDC